MRAFFAVLLTVAVSAATSKTVVPTLGSKTPGIQIPVAGLKPDLDLPAPDKPGWLFFAESVFVPAGAKVQKLDAKTGKAAEASIEAAQPCARMASGFGSLWVPSCSGGLLRIDSKTLKQIAQIPTGTASAVAISPDSVWLLADDKTTLVRIDPDTNTIVADVRLQPGCKGLAFGEGALWVLCPAQNHVLHINPATNLVTKRITVSSDPQSVAIGEGAVWVLCKKDGKVERIDPKTDKVIKTIELNLPGATGEIAAGEGSIWVTAAGFPLTRISPTAEKEKVLQQFAGPGGGVIQTSTGAIWLVNLAEGTIWKLDPKRIAATLAD